MESQEKKKRKKNIIIKELKIKNRKREETVEQILNKIGTQVEIRKIEIIGVRREKDEKMVVVKIEEKER